MRRAWIGAAVVLIGITLPGCPQSNTSRDGSIPRSDAGTSGCRSDSECDDGIDCTEDTCNASTGLCRSVVVPSLCPAGSSCNPMTGCEMGQPCAIDSDCEDDDPCTTNELCDPAARVCTHLPLDGDRDGQPPRVCGGTDCDDSQFEVYEGAVEVCGNEIDDDCDGSVDEQLGTNCERRLCIDGGCRDCQPQYVDCGGYCADLQGDVRDCGACGTSCGWPDGSSCVSGTCVCNAGVPTCDGLCVDFETSPLYCGSCDNRCPAGVRCDHGICLCPGGATTCDGECVDLDTNTNHCGACGNACLDGASCVAGVCECPAGSASCEGACPLLDSDINHCGRCGRRCGAGGSPTCSSGVCSWPRCLSSLVMCGGEEVCLDFDPMNCGSCGNACAADQQCGDDRTTGVCLTM